MDEKQRLEILELLQSNGRSTPTEIAAMVGQQPEAVSNQIEELTRQGVIVQFTTLIDWEKAGVELVTAVIDVKITPQRDVGFDRLAARIAKFPEVKSCYLMSGAYDLSVVVVAPTLKRVSQFVSERLSTMDGVASTTTHFVLKAYKHDGVLFERPDPDERLAVTP